MHERDYLERTIATVRNHRSADNCWPQWANIFADEIERLWGREAELDRSITDIGVTVLALRSCDEASEGVPARLRARIRVMEDEWFNVPTPEGARRREALRDGPTS